MSIFQKVTLEILKKNKMRTIVAIIGIILSTSMFTTTVSSVQNYLLQNAYYNHGDWHISALELDETFFDFLKNPASVFECEEEQALFEKGEVKSYVYSQQLGYAFAEGCVNEYKPYLYVMGADTNFFETMPVHLTGGRLPEKSDEILLPEHLAENGEVYYKVGDVLTLEIGNRVLEGYVLGQYNPYMNASEGEAVEGSEEVPQTDLESLEVMETRTFTVVGFYERPSFENYSAPGYTAITVMDKVRPEGSLYNFYFKMKNPRDAFTWFSNVSAAIGCSSTMNDRVLLYSGYSGFDGFYVVLYGLAAIVCGLIMFGSVSLIYNAFSISVSERTKQFGLLSSIGATKKQIRQMVLFEAMVVSIIGIPLGILSGVGGMGVTFHFIGKSFNELTHYVVPFTLCVYPMSIVVACVITLITVLISAWIPSKRATMVTAVEAIRQSGDVKLTRWEQKKLRKENKNTKGETTWGEKLAYRISGFSGMIADKYYKRSKRKYRATVVSLFMSIVLFVSASAFTSYLTDSVESSLEGNGYDLMYTYDPTMYMTLDEIENKDFSDTISQENLSKLLDEAKDVRYTTYVSKQVMHVTIENEYLSDSYVEYMTEKYEISGLEYESDYTDVNLCAVFVEDVVYEALLNSYHLDESLYTDIEQPLGIVIDGRTAFDYDLEKYVTTNILKEDSSKVLLEGEDTSATMFVGKIISERPYYVSDAYQLAVIYPYSLKNVALVEFGGRNYSCDHYILSDAHRESYQGIKNILVENGLSKNFLYNYAEGIEENRTLILIINVFSYGFIALISLIAAANVFNTISTNISLRRREFAMLKSVGMSNREMKSMMNYECVLYGTRALLYGLPVSIVITWFIYKVISEGFTTGFYMPWSAIGIAVLSVFLVVFATMMYSMRKIQKDNPIDALKNENL